MGDLVVSLSLLASAAMLAFAGSVRLSSRLGRRRRNFLAASVLLLGSAYGYWLWDRIVLSQLLPVSALIVAGNWFPMFAAVLSALIWVADDVPRFRRCSGALLLMGVAFYSCVHPLLGSAPHCGDQWQGPLCLQTTPFTCSPASAATLLRLHGISASEQEMAELCLTRSARHGTRWQGLYRGLVLKTAGTPWEVEIFECDAESSRTQPLCPAVLVARLPDDRHVDPVYQQACGWIPGQTHSVVLLHFLDESVAVVGDPQVGRELWKTSDLDVLWTGLGIRLVPRTGQCQAVKLTSLGF